MPFAYFTDVAVKKKTKGIFHIHIMRWKKLTGSYPLNTNYPVFNVYFFEGFLLRIFVHEIFRVSDSDFLYTFFTSCTGFGTPACKNRLDSYMK